MLSYCKVLVTGTHGINPPFHVSVMKIYFLNLPYAVAAATVGGEKNLLRMGGQEGKIEVTNG